MSFNKTKNILWLVSYIGMLSILIPRMNGQLYGQNCRNNCNVAGKKMVSGRGPAAMKAGRSFVRERNQRGDKEKNTKGTYIKKHNDRGQLYHYYPQQGLSVVLNPDGSEKNEAYRNNGERVNFNPKNKPIKSLSTHGRVAASLKKAAEIPMQSTVSKMVQQIKKDYGRNIKGNYSKEINSQGKSYHYYRDSGISVSLDKHGKETNNAYHTNGKKLEVFTPEQPFRPNAKHAWIAVSHGKQFRPIIIDPVTVPVNQRNIDYLPGKQKAAAAFRYCREGCHYNHMPAETVRLLSSHEELQSGKDMAESLAAIALPVGVYATGLKSIKALYGISQVGLGLKNKDMMQVAMGGLFVAPGLKHVSGKLSGPLSKLSTPLGKQAKNYYNVGSSYAHAKGSQFLDMGVKGFSKIENPQVQKLTAVAYGKAKDVSRWVARNKSRTLMEDLIQKKGSREVTSFTSSFGVNFFNSMLTGYAAADENFTKKGTIDYAALMATSLGLALARSHNLARFNKSVNLQKVVKEVGNKEGEVVKTTLENSLFTHYRYTASYVPALASGMLVNCAGKKFNLSECYDSQTLAGQLNWTTSAILGAGAAAKFAAMAGQGKRIAGGIDWGYNLVSKTKFLGAAGSLASRTPHISSSEQATLPRFSNQFNPHLETLDKMREFGTKVALIKTPLDTLDEVVTMTPTEKDPNAPVVSMRKFLLYSLGGTFLDYGTRGWAGRMKEFAKPFYQNKNLSTKEAVELQRQSESVIESLQEQVFPALGKVTFVLGDALYRNGSLPMQGVNSALGTMVGAPVAAYTAKKIGSFLPEKKTNVHDYILNSAYKYGPQGANNVVSLLQPAVVGVFNILPSSQGGGVNPLLSVISTAGFTMGSLAARDASARAQFKLKGNPLYKGEEKLAQATQAARMYEQAAGPAITAVAITGASLWLARSGYFDGMWRNFSTPKIQSSYMSVPKYNDFPQQDEIKDETSKISWSDVEALKLWMKNLLASQNSNAGQSPDLVIRKSNLKPAVNKLQFANQALRKPSIPKIENENPAPSSSSLRAMQPSSSVLPSIKSQNLGVKTVLDGVPKDPEIESLENNLQRRINDFNSLRHKRFSPINTVFEKKTPEERISNSLKPEGE